MVIRRVPLTAGVSHREPALAVAFAAVALAETLLRGLAPGVPLAILAVLTPLPLVWRLRLPLHALAATVTLLLVGEAVAQRDDYPVSLGGAALLAVYTAAAHLSGRQAEAADVLVIAAIVGSTAVVAAKSGDSSRVAAVVTALVTLSVLFRGAWLAGRRVQGRRDRRRAEAEERGRREQAALREERARIARELHDVVAHAISVIVLQARGARHALPERPAEALEAVAAVERTAAQALAEMRALLGVLRDEEPAGLAPQPSLGGLETLVADVRAAGLPVELRVEGERRELPPGLELCAYRIVQEALTNALKHAGPSTARVVLRYADDALEVEVADTGTAAGGGTPGQGLAGMRERVAIFGGRLQAGPRQGGGYLVAARLPL